LATIRLAHHDPTTNHPGDARTAIHPRIRIDDVKQLGLDLKQIVYALRDAKTGEILKVGETNDPITRIGNYQTAKTEYSNRSLVIDVLEVTPKKGQGIKSIEDPLREQVLSDLIAQSPAGTKAEALLPWDNSYQRLGRPGPGTPGVRDHAMREAGVYWENEQPVGGIPNLARKPRPPKDVLIGLLRSNRGNVVTIATSQDVDPSTVYRWLILYDLVPSDYQK
jgi:hypothetical protein